MSVHERTAAYGRARHLAVSLEPGGFNEHIRSTILEAVRAGEQAESELRQEPWMPKR